MQLKENNKLILFDFDGTITHKDSFNDFLIYTFGKKKFYCVMLKNTFNIFLYLIGQRQNHVMKSKIFSNFYKDVEYKKYLKDCEEYSNNKLPFIVRNDVLNKIKEYSKDGDLLIILSASFKEWINPWATKVGFNKIICSEVELKNDKLTGKIKEKTTCYGKNKLLLLKKEIKDLKGKYIIAYGDSKSDSYYMNIANERHWIR